MTVILLMIVLSMLTTKPYNQIAVANMDKLATAIQQVCNQQDTKTISFDLAQPKPFSFLSGGWNAVVNALFDVGKRTMISSNGDPMFVIYYEAFPPGSAWAWEGWMQLPERAVVYYNPPATDYEADGKTIKNGRDKLMNFLINVQNTDIGSSMPFVVGNIILDDVEERATKSFSPMFGAGSVGKWNIDDPSAKAFYRFVDFFQKSDTEQSLVKYRACGENMLCMKTSGGITRVPLTGCDRYNTNGNGLTILQYDVKTVEGFVSNPKLFSELMRGFKGSFYETFGITVSYSTQFRPVNLASPCSTSIVIHPPVICKCPRSAFKTYPLFEVREASGQGGEESFDLYKIGSYSDCRDLVETTTSPEAVAASPDNVNIDNCMPIYVTEGMEGEESSGFCRSYPGIEPQMPAMDKGNYVRLPVTTGDPVNGFATWKATTRATLNSLGLGYSAAYILYWPRT